MARQRVLKPTANDDEDMVKISFAGRWFYAGLWCHLDKQGLIEDVPIALRSKIYPREEIDITVIEGWIDELTRPGPSGRPRLVRVKWRGRTLLYAPTLKRHSRIFADEPEPFKVPESVLKAAREAAGIYTGEKGEPIDPPAPPPPSGGAPSQLPSASRVDPTSYPRGSHESPLNSPDSVSVPVSVPVSAKASVPVSVPVSAGPAPNAGKLRVVDNSPPGGENGGKEKSQESCALCRGTGKLQVRIQNLPNAPVTPFRCQCPLGDLAGMRTWSRWSPEHARHYEIVAEPRAG